MLNVGARPGAPPLAMRPVPPRYPAGMGIHGSQGLSVDAVLRELRQRADEDFLDPPAEHESGRHQVDLPDMELRVSLTRSRYPNTADGRDTYALTISRLQLDHPPEEAQTRRIIYALFGDAAERVEERHAGGPVVRMFRAPADAVPPNDPPPPPAPGRADPVLGEEAEGQRGGA
jgi:hypothetical protein